MRQANIILQTAGDDPLTELMELDEFYGWTRRISVLGGLFKKKRKHSALPFVIGTLFILGVILIGSYFALYYIL